VKNSMTIREKVMLGILGILCIVLAYYYLLYIPMKNETERYRQEYQTVDSTLVVVEAKAAKMAQMKAEIEAIKAGNAGDIKELPAYDNRQPLLRQLNMILAKTNNYSITFGGITGDGTTVCRQVTLNYACDDYASAKAILKEIHSGIYPCALGNISLSSEGASMSLNITYYEYGTVQ